MNLPQQATQTMHRLHCDASQVLVIANDYDYVLQGGPWQLALQIPRSRGQCWVVTPDLLLQELAIDPSNSAWIAVLADNDYSKRGLIGISVATACAALKGQPPLTLPEVLQRPAIARVWDRLDQAAQQALTSELENALLALGRYPLVSQNESGCFELSVKTLPCLSEALRQQSDREHSDVLKADAAALAAGKQVLIWGKIKSVPIHIWCVLTSQMYSLPVTDPLPLHDHDCLLSPDCMYTYLHTKSANAL